MDKHTNLGENETAQAGVMTITIAISSNKITKLKILLCQILTKTRGLCCQIITIARVLQLIP